jgi:hypothetical protein
VGWHLGSLLRGTMRALLAKHENVQYSLT